jgi:hypothetical protein
MPLDEHYKAVKEGILRARKIRQDLAKHPTEYYPEKVRGLNKAYFATIKEVIRQGNLYLDNNPDFWLGLEVAQIVENYSAFLSTRELDG